MTVRELISRLANEAPDATVMYLEPHADVADADEVALIETSKIYPDKVFLSSGTTNLRYGV